MNHADFLIVGGGVVGISIAREIKSRQPSASVLLLEKEAECGLHASGRNSGVLHAGFYYSADSLKARLTRDGKSACSRDYCASRKIPVNKCGKLVVARDESELPQLDELLLRRGQGQRCRTSIPSPPPKPAPSNPASKPLSAPFFRPPRRPLILWRFCNP